MLFIPQFPPGCSSLLARLVTPTIYIRIPRSQTKIPTPFRSTEGDQLPIIYLLSNNINFNPSQHTRNDSTKKPWRCQTLVIENTYRPINTTSDHYPSRKYLQQKPYSLSITCSMQSMNLLEDKSTSKASKNSMITCRWKERARGAN